MGQVTQPVADSALSRPKQIALGGGEVWSAQIERLVHPPPLPVQDLWGACASEMLTVQYRMHAALMDWSSRELYAGRLEAHTSVAAHTLAGLPGE